MNELVKLTYPQIINFLDQRIEKTRQSDLKDIPKIRKENEIDYITILKNAKIISKDKHEQEEMIYKANYGLIYDAFRLGSMIIELRKLNLMRERGDYNQYSGSEALQTLNYQDLNCKSPKEMEQCEVIRYVQHNFIDEILDEDSDWQDIDSFISDHSEGKQHSIYSTYVWSKNERKKRLIDLQKLENEKRLKDEFDAVVYETDGIEWIKKQPLCDLLITDPPYMTDVDDINKFSEWLPIALSKVKPTGRAYIFIGAYPQEILAYLKQAMPDQILVWTYENTIGPTPKDKYILNWQAILYFKMPQAKEFKYDIVPIMTELFAVKKINAPDGRQYNREYKYQKPDELAQLLIGQATKEGDLVYDPFAGSGTFLLNAAKLGCRVSGCEINKEVLKIANKRGCKIQPLD